MTTDLLDTTLINGETCLIRSNLPLPCYHGKVRDCYDLGDELLLVSTDRVSAFDRILGVIPFKGQVLTQLSAWWFQHTRHIFPNHFIALANANTMHVKKCELLPIEIVVRGYITGTTQTSLWTLYEKGQREFAGVHLPNGLQKNQPLPEPIVTPTTKEETHDRPYTQEELASLSFLKLGEWEQLKRISLNLFNDASVYLKARGIILADTKYEFGRTPEGNIILIDELHTPDSSRYWDATTYETRYNNRQEPESFDKEILRLWYKEHTKPYNDTTLPEPPSDLTRKVSERYKQLYKLVTEQSFKGEPVTCVASLVSSHINP